MENVRRRTCGERYLCARAGLGEVCCRTRAGCRGEVLRLRDSLRLRDRGDAGEVSAEPGAVRGRCGTAPLVNSTRVGLWAARGEAARGLGATDGEKSRRRHVMGMPSGLDAVRLFSAGAMVPAFVLLCVTNLDPSYINTVISLVSVAMLSAFCESGTYPCSDWRLTQPLWTGVCHGFTRANWSSSLYLFLLLSLRPQFQLASTQLT